VLSQDAKPEAWTDTQVSVRASFGCAASLASTGSAGGLTQGVLMELGCAELPTDPIQLHLSELRSNCCDVSTVTALAKD